MSTSPKNSGKKPKNACQAEIRPQFAKMPCSRDQRAYKLRLAGLKQEQIAAKLGCSQPTVHRGIGRMEKWVATTLPEDRGEFVATEKLRLALHRHETLLVHLQRRALRDYRRSQRPVPVERVVTRKVTRTKGDEQTVTDETRTEKSQKPQRGQVALLSYAGKVSHELTVMASGYLGPGNGSISLAKVMDPDERDRWERMVDRRDAIIGRLEKRVAELEATLAAKNSTPHAPREDVHTRSARSPWGELTPAANDPAVNKVPSLDVVATPTQNVVCDQPMNAGEAPSHDLENLNKTPPQQGTQSTLHAPREESTSRSEMGTILEEPYDESVEFCATRTPKWNSMYRQEALDLHCRIHGIPPLELHRVTGLPDPMRISPKLAIERGYPYHLFVDYSIPSKREPVRDKQKVITVSEW